MFCFLVKITGLLIKQRKDRKEETGNSNVGFTVFLCHLICTHLQHTLINSHTCFRFMVGCGRCDDWFHGDCVGLDLTKVREMEEEDQMYVCLKCCEEESKKVEPEPPTAAKPDVQAKTEIQDQKSPSKPRPGSSQTLAPGGIKPVRKVSSVTVSSYICLI